MTKKVIKNQPMKIEFGDCGNYATLTPIAIEKVETNYTIVIMKYDDGRQIDLCFNHNEINQDSFK